MAGSEADILSVGDLFHDRYEVLRQLGAGGMGAVYEVLDQNTQRRRALKVMLPRLVEEPELRRRFRAEATVAAAIESEHIAEVLNAGIDENTTAPFIVLELLKGEELAEMVKARGPMDAQAVTFFLTQTAGALDKAHAAGVVHRDLKPENLFVTYRDDGTPLVKILDFGIAKVVTSTLNKTQTTGLLGTPAYMATEQIDGDLPISGRTDGYAMGHIAYTLFVGEPYWGEELSTARSLLHLISRIVKGPTEPPSQRALRRKEVWLAPGFDAWFQKATASDPGARFESVGASIRALCKALNVTTVTPPDLSQPASSRPVASVEEQSSMATVTSYGTGEDVDALGSTTAGSGATGDGTRVSATPEGGSGVPSSELASMSKTGPLPSTGKTGFVPKTGTSVSAGVSVSTGVPTSNTIDPTSAELPKRSNLPFVAGLAAIVTLGAGVAIFSFSGTNDAAAPAMSAAPVAADSTSNVDDSGAAVSASNAAPAPEPGPAESSSAVPEASSSAPIPASPPIAAPKPTPPKPAPPKPAPPKPAPPKPAPPKPDPGVIDPVVPSR